MEKPLTITAVCGWALPTEWFQEQIENSFPQAKINVLYPSEPDDSQEAECLLKSFHADLYIGYSLGSLWLMTYQEMLPKTAVKAVLAPVLAFARERNRGGKTLETKLKYLARKLGRNPEDPSPLLEFYSDAGIHLPNMWLKRVPDNKVLLKGLEFLQYAPVPSFDLKGYVALVGKKDGFLDGGDLKHHIPQLEIIPEANHAPEPLLKRLAEIMKHTPHG
jgi:hypothetical protein